MTDVAGRTAFITGGAQGIGLGIARAFAAAGARLALADLDATKLTAAGRELAESTEVETFQFDVRDRGAFARAADAAEDRLGPVSVLVNNAGVGTATPLDRLTYEVWDHVLGINLGGTVNGLQTFLPRLLDRGGSGHIVNVASGAGLAASNKFLYVTSKFAVVGLSESLSQQAELAERGIGVTVVCPGIVRTHIMANSRAHVPDAATENGGSDQLFDRFGLSPEIVGEQVLRGVRNDQLYVHTDRMLAEPIRQRTKALLDAMPPETERDRELAAVFEAEILAVIQRPLSSGGR
jgi:NAD(P)-dependent dehydrogenase (short-subunit alcohol dehydrogenase family)